MSATIHRLTITAVGVTRADALRAAQRTATEAAKDASGGYTTSSLNCSATAQFTTEQVPGEQGENHP